MKTKSQPVGLRNSLTKPTGQANSRWIACAPGWECEVMPVVVAGVTKFVFLIYENGVHKAPDRNITYATATSARKAAVRFMHRIFELRTAGYPV